MEVKYMLEKHTVQYNADPKTIEWGHHMWGKLQKLPPDGIEGVNVGN